MHDIVHELTIATPPDQVFEAITTVDHIGRWWTPDVAIAPDRTELRVAFQDGAVQMHFQVDASEAPELLHLVCTDGPAEWPGTQLAFRIEQDPHGLGSVVRLWHGGWEYEDGSLPRASFLWAMRLDSLRRYLEQGTGSPAS